MKKIKKIEYCPWSASNKKKFNAIVTKIVFLAGIFKSPWCQFVETSILSLDDPMVFGGIILDLNGRMDEDIKGFSVVLDSRKLDNLSFTRFIRCQCYKTFFLCRL